MRRYKKSDFRESIPITFERRIDLPLSPEDYLIDFEIAKKMDGGNYSLRRRRVSPPSEPSNVMLTFPMNANIVDVPCLLHDSIPQLNPKSLDKSKKIISKQRTIMK